MDLPQYDPRDIKVRTGEHPDDVQTFRNNPSFRNLWGVLKDAVAGLQPLDYSTIENEQRLNDRVRRAELRRLRELHAAGEQMPRNNPRTHRTAWAHTPPPK